MKLKSVPIVLAIFLIAGCDHRQEIAKLTSDADGEIAQTNYEQAIKNYSEVIRLDHQFAAAYVARGGAYSVLNKYDLAITDLNEGIRLDPKNYLAYRMRGNAFLRKRQFEKAINDLNFALSDKSDDAEALETRGQSFKLRGMIYYESRSFTNAIADFTEAVKYRTDDYQIYEFRGDCYDIRTNADAAFSDYEKAIQLNSKAVMAIYGRGHIYSRTGQYTNAAQDFENVIQLRPKTFGAYNLLAWLLATCPDNSLRDGKKAVELATQACDMTKWTNYAYVDTLAAAYAESGDFEHAVKYQKQAASMDGIPEDNRTNVQDRIQLYLQHKPYRKSKPFTNYD